jgi:alkanesulfonate monooxygenase SsuD/methylene tetrahydromethanopterin reductase-like flavin-dependent oxidoreductase (luciferase family)
MNDHLTDFNSPATAARSSASRRWPRWCIVFPANGSAISSGIELPAMRERFDRFESAVKVIKALGSPEASRPPGIVLEDPTYPLREATNEPPPLTPGGPPLWLGGQKSRGIRIAARYADGWNYTGSVPESSVEEFIRRRDELFRACKEIGRNPNELTVSVQIRAGDNARERRLATELGRAYARSGCDHLILVTAGRFGADGLRTVATEIAEPLRRDAVHSRQPAASVVPSTDVP